MRKLVDVSATLTDAAEASRLRLAQKRGGRVRADERFYHALSEHLRPYYLADADGRLIESNPAFARLCAWLLRRQAPRPGEPAPAMLRRIFEGIRANPEPVEVTENLQVDDEVRTYRATHFPVYDDQADTLLGFGGVYVDLTDQVAAKNRADAVQRRYEDILRSTSDWLWETDADMRLTAVSPRITATLGEPARRLIGRPLSSLGAFAKPIDGQPAATELIESHLPFRNQPFEVKNADGETRHIHLSGVSVFDEESGRFVGYRGTGSDMTRQIAAESFANWARRELERTLEELKNQNSQLDLALARAQAADTAKSSFLAMMSHELRTPLNAIIGFSELAVNQAAGPVPNPYDDYAKEVLAAGRHLLGLVVDLLDLTNIESGRLSVEAKSTALRPLIAEAWMQVSLRAEERAMELSRFQVNERIEVLADPVRVRQIFLNLLSNAVKFGEEGGHIGIESAGPADGYVETIVWNTGEGIAPEVREKLFEGFQKADQDAYTSGSGGMGLGLTLARRLARLMDGDVRLDHRDQSTARFVVRLPLGTRVSEPAAEPAPEQPAADAGAPGRRPRTRVTIVRVDDA